MNLLYGICGGSFGYIATKDFTAHKRGAGILAAIASVGFFGLAAFG